MKINEKYCSYITFYRGNMLPPFYIGSTSVNKIYRGYKGTVSSREYRDAWKMELKKCPHKFSTKIIKIFDTREEAYNHEEYIQIKLKVINNDLYTNQSIWTLKCFNGRSNFKHSEKSKNKIKCSLIKFYSNPNNVPVMQGKSHKQETKEKLSISQKKAWEDPNRKPRSPNSLESRKRRSENIRGNRHPRYGTNHSEETKQKISKAKIGKSLNLTENQRRIRSETTTKNRTGKKHSEETKQILALQKIKYKWIVTNICTKQSFEVGNLMEWCKQTFERPQSACTSFRQRRSYNNYLAERIII